MQLISNVSCHEKFRNQARKIWQMLLLLQNHYLKFQTSFSSNYLEVQSFVVQPFSEILIIIQCTHHLVTQFPVSIYALCSCLPLCHLYAVVCAPCVVNCHFQRIWLSTVHWAHLHTEMCSTNCWILFVVIIMFLTITGIDGDLDRNDWERNDKSLYTGLLQE